MTRSYDKRSPFATCPFFLHWIVLEGCAWSPGSYVATMGKAMETSPLNALPPDFMRKLKILFPSWPTWLSWSINSDGFNSPSGHVPKLRVQSPFGMHAGGN